MRGRAAAAEDALLRASTRLVAQRRGRAAEARHRGAPSDPTRRAREEPRQGTYIAWTAHDDEFSSRDRSLACSHADLLDERRADGFIADREGAFGWTAPSYPPGTRDGRTGRMRKLIVWNVMTLDGYFEGPTAWDLDM